MKTAATTPAATGKGIGRDKTTGQYGHHSGCFG
jgi:hypothetical protein